MSGIMDEQTLHAFVNAMVVYQDASIMVVNKPAGLLTVPGKSIDLQDCLLSRLQHYDNTVLLVHRLDRDTSGLLVFARNKHAQRTLSKQFELKQTHKTYVAHVYGQVHTQPATLNRIDIPVRYEPNTPPLHITDTQHAKQALTDWELVSQHECYARLYLYPITGRSHQLRVHMQYIGHPIVGDTLYAKQLLGTLANETRLYLHAMKLSIIHPDTQLSMTFEQVAEF